MSPSRDTKLPRESSRKAVARFRKHGWVVERERGKGSHICLVKEGRPRPVILPETGLVKPGVLKNCLRVAGLSVAEYLNPPRGPR